MERRPQSSVVDSNSLMELEMQQAGLNEYEQQGIRIGRKLGKLPRFISFTHEFKRYYRQLLRVGIHESGHEHKVIENGDQVLNVTTVASGNTLGSVSWRTNSSDPESSFSKGIQAAHAGEAVESIFGIHSDGSGHDRGIERLLATNLSRIKGFSPESILGPLRRSARESVSSAGPSYFIHRAWHHIGDQFKGIVSVPQTRLAQSLA